MRISGLKESLERRPSFGQASGQLPLPPAGASAGAVQNPAALVLEAEPDIMMLSANTVHTDAEALQSIVAPPPPIDHGFTLENVVFLRLVHSRIATARLTGM